MHIGEEPKHPIPMRSAVGAGIYMNQLVAGVRLERSSLLFERPEAGRSGAATAEEVRHRASQKLLHACTVSPENRARALRDVGSGVQAREAIPLSLVADRLGPHLPCEPV